jgi:hypothetical protein
MKEKQLKTEESIRIDNGNDKSSHYVKLIRY